MLGVIAGDITGSQFESPPVPRPPDLPAPWPKPLHGLPGLNANGIRLGPGQLCQPI